MNYINQFLRVVGHCEWLRFGIRNRLIQLLSKPNPLSFTVPMLDLRYAGRFDRFIDREVYFFGAFEKSELVFLSRLLSLRGGDSIVLDVGANVGLHSFFLSRFAAEVHAFEPYEEVRSIFTNRVQSNEISNIHIYPLALGEKAEELTFYAPSGNNTGIGSFLAEHDPSNVPIGKLQVVVGDSFLQTLPIKRLDLVKIDVEGFEASVLRGLKSILGRFRPMVFCEISTTTLLSIPANGSNLTHLFPEKYRLFTVLSNQPSFVFFNTPDVRLAPYSQGPCNLIAVPEEDVPQLSRFGATELSKAVSI